MLKNITLSADEQLIQRAREKAATENTTLNASFRQWLRQYTNSFFKNDDYENLIRRTGLYDGPRRKVNSPTGKEIPDDEYSWCEHSARRLATDSPNVVRPHLRKYLLSKRFGLD